jgi:hypothetical protein
MGLIAGDSQMAKIKVQARNLQPGDVTGSGEVIRGIQNSPRIPYGYGKHQTGKVGISLEKGDHRRYTIWGAYTEISVERA